MKKVKFLFGIHCHQPIGNFEHIVEEAYQKAYLPFIEVMERHPKIKFSFHYSGILYDFFMEKHPDFMEKLKALIRRGQAEVMTAGYYEPIISIIPDDDKIGQIAMQNDFILEKFGVPPRGMWLTERIWEPQIAKPLADAGIEYVTVDDYHFLSAGVSPSQLLGYSVTEEEGKILKIFPISKTLRYLIPFKLPEETIKYLERIASERESVVAIIADDGEKFGVWPGTHQWVYEEGYLEKLLTILEANASWIETLTFSQYLDAYPPQGRIYLPTASYFEMMEWSLPTESGVKLEKILSELKAAGKFEEYQQFFKGGFFRNFFVKYPEANHLHKKMLSVSQKLQTLRRGKVLVGEKEKDKRLKEAQIELYKGQCNCAYWHGVFGGLYLNYLRHAVYEHLIKAEVLMDKYSHAKEDFIELTVTDFDKDGQDEVIISNNFLNLYFSPAVGGALTELDYKPKAFNLSNTLARRPEIYHQKTKEAPAQAQEKGTTTIHERLSVKEGGLEKALVYDGYPRLSLLDHFLPLDMDLSKMKKASYTEEGDFIQAPYEFMPQRKTSEVSLFLKRDGKVGEYPIRVTKTITLYAKQSIVNIAYEIINLASKPIDLWFGPEFNLTLLASTAPDRYFEIPGIKLSDSSLGSAGISDGIKLVKLVDEWTGFSVSLEFGKEANLWRFPIETVSQSEGGFEKTYQGSVIFPNWKFNLAPDSKWTVELALRIEGR